MKQIQLTSTTLRDKFFEYAGHCIDGEFVVTNETNEALDKVFKTIEENRFGVCLLGNPGAGKTFIFEVLRRVLHPKDEQHFIKKSCIGVVEDYNIENDRKGGSGDNILRQACFKKNILWDDLMREKKGKYNVDVMPEIIFNADERYKQQGLKTHLTCNFMGTSNDPDELTIEKRYGNYVYSRVKGMCEIIGLEPNRDFRSLKNFKSFPMVYHPARLTQEEIDWNKNYEESKNKIHESRPFKGLGTQMKEQWEKLGKK